MRLTSAAKCARDSDGRVLLAGHKERGGDVASGSLVGATRKVSFEGVAHYVSILYVPGRCTHTESKDSTAIHGLSFCEWWSCCTSVEKVGSS